MTSADGEEKCGKVTSYTSLHDGQHIALGYVRCRSKGVQVELAGKQVLHCPQRLPFGIMCVCRTLCAVCQCYLGILRTS